MNNEEQKLENKQESVPSESVKVLTPEEAKEFRGRVPRALAPQVKAMTRMKHTKQKKDGTVVKARRLDMFIDEYLRNGGNATRAAMVLFDCSSKAYASRLGSMYLTQAKQIGRIILDDSGYTYKKLVESIGAKAVDPNVKDPAWVDRALKIGGYDDFMSKSAPAQQTVNVMNVHKDLLDKYVEGSFEAELPEEEFDGSED